MDALPPALLQTLRLVAEAMERTRDPWWIIASAAMVLHGARQIDCADVDLLTSERDAEAFLAAQGLDRTRAGASDRFRSRVFARWKAPPLPVEIMAGFEVRAADGWHLICPVSRIRKQIGNTALFMPSVDELLAHCRLFDRPKDQQRATILQRLDS